MGKKRKKEKEITDIYMEKQKHDPRKRAEIELFNLEFGLSIIFEKEENKAKMICLPSSSANTDKATIMVSLLG